MISNINVHRFWPKYVDDGKGGLKEQHWVEYSARHTDKIRNESRVDRLLNVVDVPPETNPTVRDAMDRRDVIKLHYEAWLAGREVPETGTPLAAWNGVSTEQAEILRVKGIKTVEDVAGMGDAIMNGIPLPGLVALKQSAARFLASADSSKAAAQMAKIEEDRERLRLESEEQRQMLNAMAEKLAAMEDRERRRVIETRDEDEAPVVKRKPGRPPAHAAA
jgi:isopentenyl diphosphate isomerase/L-lactate dehydrogenase-like FMN-dependent dehydrogenase